jgi:hypothetical protein
MLCASRNLTRSTLGVNSTAVHAFILGDAPPKDLNRPDTRYLKKICRAKRLDIPTVAALAPGN